MGQKDEGPQRLETKQFKFTKTKEPHHQLPDHEGIHPFSPGTAHVKDHKPKDW